MITIKMNPGFRQPTTNETMLFSADLKMFMEAAGVDNVLKVDVKNYLVEVDGVTYDVINYVFGSDQPFVIECKPRP